MDEQAFDVLVVGGGINGAGIARDLAGRGWRVLLVEQDDLASHTSSSSTKLIHGGLRYLEYYEFGLVRKALQEREVLLKSAPHIMWPLRFVMPHDPEHTTGLDDPHRPLPVRPSGAARSAAGLHRRQAAGQPARRAAAAAVHAGLRLFRRLGRRRAARRAERHRRTRAGCHGADAHALRRSAAQRQRLDRDAACHRWQRADRAARALVNAAGPWAEAFLRGIAQPAAGEALASKSLRLVKGSHIVVPRCFEHDHAYIFQNPDKRIIFAIPYEDDFTLIGTTDVEIQGDPRGARIAPDEIAYLCEQASRYFKKPVLPADVVWSYAGVRPLLDDASGDPSAVTRDYLLESQTDAAPLLSVWGGKITTFRKLAEEAADEVGPHARRTAPGLDRQGLAAGRRPVGLDRRRRPPRPRLRSPRGRRARAPPVAGCGAGAAPGARLRRAHRQGAARTISAPRSRPASSKANCSTCAPKNGRPRPTTCCGAAASWACTSPAHNAAASPTGWRARRTNSLPLHMQLTLDRITRQVGASPWLYEMTLAPQPGAVTVLLGATQAGKTSLMRVMAGLDKPTTGQVRVDGNDVTAVGVRERNVAMVYQQFINYPSMTVFDNIASPLKLRGEKNIDSTVRALAARLHIEMFLDRLPAALSGGQQQRVALARALAKNAPLMLLDEPLVNLDYKLREELREELAQLFASRRQHRHLRHHRAWRSAAAGGLHRGDGRR